MKFTQQLTMHLNGGSDYSVLQFAVLADGKPTQIQHVQRTDGRPRYTIVVDVFSCGGDEFDVLATRRIGLMQWLIDHVDVVVSSPHGDVRTEATA